MEYPKRVDKHITESSSFKIFSNSIPDEWIIREVSERDYGIDLYIELAKKDHSVTGELISIQLKGAKKINWTKEDYVTYSAVKISTTNYWRKFPIPVFFCMVDIETKEVFFCPVKSYIRKNFYAYAEQKQFSYQVKRENKLSKNELREFILSYFREKFLEEMESHMVTFISHISEYENFFRNNQGRDQFLGVETDRVLYMEHCYNNLKFLYDYFEFDWGIEPLMEYYKASQEMFGKDERIYELQMDEVVTELESKVLPMLLQVRDHITETEKEYWMIRNIQLFNYMINVREDGSLPQW